MMKIAPAAKPPPAEPPGGLSWRAFMQIAFREACAAGRAGEVPIGAALIGPDGTLIAAAHNESITLHDPTAHAEILCLREAGRKLGNHRLTGTILAVTLEPCLMCLGAILQARLAGLVFAADDPKAGAVISNLDGANLPFANHRFWFLGGVLAEECRTLLQSFFLARRKDG